MREVDPAKFLSETGLLFEINRIVLHPYGFTLGVTENMELVLSDYSDVEGGLLYDKKEWTAEKKLISNFAAKYDVVKRISERLRMTGFIVQESADGPRPDRSKNSPVRRPRKK